MARFNLVGLDGKIIEDTGNRIIPERILFGSSLNPTDEEERFIENGKFEKFEFNFLDNIRVLLLSKFNFYKNGLKKAYSNSSEAYYMLWHQEGESGFLLQYLPPNSVTSRHYHNHQSERFTTLEGECYLKVDNTIFPLSSRCSKDVKSREVHMIYTSSSPAINLIEIKNVDYRDHVEVNDNDYR